MRKGSKHTEGAKRKIGKANKGKHYSPSTEFKKGQTPCWNKGIKMNRIKYPNYGMRNKHHSEKTRKRLSKIGKSKIGNLNSFYGGHHSEKTRKLIGKSTKRLWKDRRYRDGVRKSMSKTLKKLWQTKKYKRRMCRVSKRNWQNARYRIKHSIAVSKANKNNPNIITAQKKKGRNKEFREK